MMKLDLHVHTNAGSGDSMIDYRDLVDLARKAGLDGLCLTEHGMQKTGLGEKLAREYDFLVIEGMEAGTELGDILIFGLESLPRSLYRAADMRQYVEKHGGVMIAAHPFRSEITRCLQLKTTPKLTMEQACCRPVFHLVDAVEAANGWSAAEDVDFCFSLCAQIGKHTTGGSDAHMSRQVGCCATIFENTIRNEQDLVAEIKLGRFHGLDCRSQEQKTATYWFS
ncbi:MAG: PHP domain-containing protein [Chloroflexi bacterium]|nr:PHP domain-containing protein [Chloroflexota bacterium]